MKARTIGELREIINSIPDEYYDYPLSKGNSRVEIEIILADWYYHIDVDLNVLNKKEYIKFSNVQEIARAIAKDKKIAAIKKIRSQCYIGLKEAKEYLENYISLGEHDKQECYRAALKFIDDHTQIEFIKKDEIGF
jgi:hypothetical protein